MHTSTAGVHPDVSPENTAATDADVESAVVPAAHGDAPEWGSPMSWITRPDPPLPAAPRREPRPGPGSGPRRPPAAAEITD